MILRKTILVLTLVLAALSGFALDDIPNRPSPPRLVNDYVQILHGAEGEQLEAKLAQFDAQTGSQIAVVIVDDFAGYDKAGFATEVGEKWGVGQKGFDNGIVVALKPKIGNQRGEIFIAVGYGLEALIPDIATKRIIEAEMIPYFKQNDYYGGLEAGTNVLMKLALEEFPAQDYVKKKEEGVPWAAVIFLLFMVFIIFGVSALRVRRYARSHNMGWVAAWMLMSSMNSNHGGSYGNFRSGSGGFGGFGGFGGGSFGGGGAGGSW